MPSDLHPCFRRNAGYGYNLKREWRNSWMWRLEESYGKGDGRLIFTINGVSDTHFIQVFKEF